MINIFFLSWVLRFNMCMENINYLIPTSREERIRTCVKIVQGDGYDVYVIKNPKEWL